MNFLQSKRDLVTFTPQDVNLLFKHYNIHAENENDRLWLLSIAIFSDKKYAQMSPSVPVDFDDYFNEIRTLGRGSFGFVILAELKQDYKNLHKGEYVAIKLINASQLSQKVLNDTQQEVDILRDVSSMEYGCNPHVVCYYDSFMTRYAPKHVKKRYFAILMEYIPGQNLRELIGQETLLSNSRILQFMKTLTSTLQLLHGKNIVHRDIKTDNIMLTKKDDVIYIDFGLSCFTMVAHKYACIQDPKGTPVSMSPELWRIYFGELENISRNDLYALYKKSDVWALGIVFYEMLYGVLPPEVETATTREQLATTVMLRPLSFPPNFQRDQRLIEVVRGMLFIDPDGRSDLVEIIDELNAL